MEHEELKPGQILKYIGPKYIGPNAYWYTLKVIAVTGGSVKVVVVDKGDSHHDVDFNFTCGANSLLKFELLPTSPIQ